MNRHLRAIRLSTERYAELQGLRLVLVGSAFVGCFGTHALLGARAGATGFVIAMLATLVLSLPGMWLLDGYYARRFGRVVQTQRSDTRTWLVIAAAVGSTIINNWLKVGPIGFALGIMGPVALWVVIRDWPSRAYYLLPGCAAATAFWVAFTASPADRALADALAMTLVGATYIPTGLLDHRLLTTAMPGREASGPAGAATRSSAPDTE